MCRRSGMYARDRSLRDRKGLHGSFPEKMSFAVLVKEGTLTRRQHPGTRRCCRAPTTGFRQDSIGMGMRVVGGGCHGEHFAPESGRRAPSADGRGRVFTVCRRAAGRPDHGGGAGERTEAEAEFPPEASESRSGLFSDSPGGAPVTFGRPPSRFRNRDRRAFSGGERIMDAANAGPIG